MPLTCPQPPEEDFLLPQFFLSPATCQEQFQGWEYSWDPQYHSPCPQRAQHLPST